MAGIGAKSRAAEWDQFKNDVKLIAIERGTLLRHKEREKIEELQCQLDFMISMEASNPGLYGKDICEVKGELEAMDIEKYRSAVIRARAEKIWLGETPNKRALCDERRYATQNEIREITYQNTITSDIEEIERAFVEHYENLIGVQRSGSIPLTQDTLDLMPRLDGDTRALLEKPISVDEIKQAITELPLGKTPGPDGLGAAFYKAYADELAPILHAVITEAYETREMPLFPRCSRGADS